MMRNQAAVELAQRFPSKLGNHFRQVTAVCYLHILRWAIYEMPEGPCVCDESNVHSRTSDIFKCKGSPQVLWTPLAFPTPTAFPAENYYVTIQHLAKTIKSRCVVPRHLGTSDIQKMVSNQCIDKTGDPRWYSKGNQFVYSAVVLYTHKQIHQWYSTLTSESQVR
jgi:hypothetical protein